VGISICVDCGCVFWLRCFRRCFESADVVAEESADPFFRHACFFVVCFSLFLMLLLPFHLLQLERYQDIFFHFLDQNSSCTYTLVVNDLANASKTSFVFASGEENNTALLNVAPLRCGDVGGHCECD
jgi:hypothetical protein